jgi:hypothetical protein
MARTAAVEELLRRKVVKKAKLDWLAAFFDEQRGFVTSESKLLAALCSRRAGKSIGNAGRLLRAAEKFPGEGSVYVALTKNNARMVVGRALMDLSRRYDLNLRIKEVDQRLHCVHPNGSYIWLAGAKNRVDFEQFRGYHFAEIIVDEAQLYGGWLHEVVEDIIEPCVGDLDGAIALTGTPSPLPLGYFHSVTTGEDVDEHGSRIPQWETHHWTVAENRHFRPADGGGAAWRDTIRARRGWGEDHPTLLREYYGRWIKDLGALVYPIDMARGPGGEPARNEYVDLPPGEYTYVIGVDVGYTDDTAFVVLAFRRGFPEVYVVEASTHSHMIPTRIATHLMRLRAAYGPAKIVVDAAARGYIEEFKQRYGISCEGSEKQNKVAYATMLRGDITSGIVKMHRRRAGPLIDQCRILQWKEDHTAIDARFEDHIADAFLYGWRATRTFYRPELEGPEVGTEEWINAESVKHKGDLIKSVDRQLRASWQALKDSFAPSRSRALRRPYRRR